MSTPVKPRLFRFGLFEADLDNAQLTRKGVRIRLQEQPFRILAMLLEHSGQIVTREDLRRDLWPEGTFVSFDRSLNAALNRLRAALGDDADNPRFIETIPKRGYRFIAPVDVESARQPGAAALATPVPAASSAVAANAAAAATPESRLKYSNRRSILTITATLAAVAVAILLAFHRRPAQPLTSPDAKSVDIGSLRRSVAVLGFQNASGRQSDTWLATALAEMLRTELGAGGKLRVVPGENVAQFRAGAPWSNTDSLSRPTASRVGKALDSDLLVLGSFAALGDPQNGSVRVDFRLQDAQTGEILYEGAESGSERQFFGLVATVGADLRGRLGLPMISESDEAGVVSSLPSDAGANRFYSLGLEKLRDADVAAAKDLFLQAEKLAPRFPLVHLMLSRAWGGLGYDQKAKQEITTAYELSSGLPEVDRLQIEGAYYGSILERDKAISAYRALRALYPDSVDYGEQLVVALNGASRYEEALAVIHELRRLPPPASEDPRIDFWEGRLISYSQGTAAQPFFEKAAAGASSRGQKLLYARFRLDQCLNLVYGDRPQGAVRLCREAYDIFIAAGNRMYAADALRTMGDRRGAEGDLNGARELYQRAVALLAPLGEHEKTGVVLNNMAITYENQGQIGAAEQLFRRAASTWTECGDLLHAGVALGNLGDILLMRGQLRQAENQYEIAKKQIEVTDPNGVAYDLYNIAVIRLYKGDTAGAKLFGDQAMIVARRRKSNPDVAAADQVLGTIEIAADDLAGARDTFQEALDILQSRGQKSGAAESQAALGEVSLEAGKPYEAEQSLRKALAEFRAETAVIDEIHTETDLSHALLEQNKVSEARATLSDAVKLNAGSPDPAMKLPLVIMDARIQAAELGARANAKSEPELSVPREKLVTVTATARRLGYYQIECEARLALAELELREHSPSARTHLAELARDAREHGLNLVSRKAAALADSADRIKPRGL
jgi:DNA-binding winged helix-turn-helix (wHTH) protein/tetratricopeptide (TPR) repeat protein/TolB-like protein